MTRKAIGANIHLLKTNEGGRSQALLSGYRSLLRFEGTEVDFGFELELRPQVLLSALDDGSGRMIDPAGCRVAILQQG